MAIIDKRKQKRTITIKFEKEGFDYDLDNLVDKIIREIEVVCYQRNLPLKTKIKINIK